MSYTLKESCKIYEKYHRIKQKSLTFSQFNALKGTCLPSNNAVYVKFMNSLFKAKKSEGIPVTRRLYSLYNALSTSVQEIATPAPQAQIAQHPPSPSVLYSQNVQHNIRPPQLASHLELMSVSDPLQKYQHLLQSEDSKFVDCKGRMIHLVESDGIPMLSNTCVLNKHNGAAMFTGSGSLIMRNKSRIDLVSLSIDPDDHREFIRARKNKESGPYFLRVTKNA